MKLSIIGACAASFAAILAVQPAQAGQCSANANSMNTWTGGQAGEAHWFTKFQVMPQCAGSCNGMVKFRLSYRTASGSTHFENRMAQWRSQGSRSVETTAEVTSPVCNNSDRRCSVLDVSVLDVTCYP